jgi:hypothetical protein
MKRLNPKTAVLFKKGDVREDGYVFGYYQNTRIKKDGFCKEVWLSPEMFAKDVELHKAASKAYYAKNADKENARSIAWKQKNRSRANELKRQSWHKHAESNQEKLRVRYIGNKQYYLNQALLWQKQNPSKVAARTMRRNLAKIQRTPPWLGGDDHWMIEQAYELAALRTKMFGFVWHVDHIIPLRGKTVSGLHVPWNLQVIPGVENNRKGNRLMGNVS